MDLWNPTSAAARSDHGRLVFYVTNTVEQT
jgi:hypothetical protein